MSACSTREWAALRARLFSRLREDAGHGLVDPDILPVLEALNRCPFYATASSCSGRIVVIASTEPGDKYAAMFTGKWHRPVRPHELAEAVERASGRIVWASAQPPILSVYSCSVKAADMLVQAAQESGFKYSCYHRARFLHVRILGTQRVDVPLFYHGRKVVTIDYDGLAELLNSYLYAGKAVLERFKKRLAYLVGAVCGEATLY